MKLFLVFPEKKLLISSNALEVKKYCSKCCQVQIFYPFDDHLGALKYRNLDEFDLEILHEVAHILV